MTVYQTWLPGYREEDPIIYPATTDRMTVLAELRKHPFRGRYVTIWEGLERRGHMMFKPGQSVTSEDFT